jgi:hypothetical protein
MKGGLTLTNVRRVCHACGMTVENSDDAVIVRIGKPPAATFHFTCFYLESAKLSHNAISGGLKAIRV